MVFFNDKVAKSNFWKGARDAHHIGNFGDFFAVHDLPRQIANYFLATNRQRQTAIRKSKYRLTCILLYFCYLFFQRIFLEGPLFVKTS